MQTSAVFATETLGSSPATGTCSVNLDTSPAVFEDNTHVPLTSQIYYNTTSGKLLHSIITHVATCTDGSSNKWYTLTLADSIATQASGDTATLYTPAGNVGNATSGFVDNLYAINGQFVTTVASGGFDVAEQYQTTDASMVPGDVVSADGADEIAKSSSGYDAGVVGVISTTPGLTLGVNLGASWQKVALTGRVPVLVSDENGVPAVGDFLTASANLPGYAMRATHSGKVIGEVLDAWSATSTAVQIVNGMAIHTESIDVDLHVGWEDVANTFVMGAGDPDNMAAATSSSTFIIRQNIATSSPVADILQLQSGSVTRLMVALMVR